MAQIRLLEFNEVGASKVYLNADFVAAILPVLAGGTGTIIRLSGAGEIHVEEHFAEVFDAVNGGD